MHREANFVEFPGTGMWATKGRYHTMVSLYRHLPPEQVARLVNENMRVFWMDQGTGVATLLRVIEGGKSASVTEVTPAILKRYWRK
jgi:hypothetical protein